jgi:hypothetical protein
MFLQLKINKHLQLRGKMVWWSNAQGIEHSSWKIEVFYMIIKKVCKFLTFNMLEKMIHN